MADAHRFVELDVGFHSLLARAAGNRVAVIVTEVLGNVEKRTLLDKMSTQSDSERLALGAVFWPAIPRYWRPSAVRTWTRPSRPCVPTPAPPVRT